MTRHLLARLWYWLALLAFGMLACFVLMEFGYVVYWLAFALWGPS